MERKKALATAASISAVALAGTLALGANVGLFGLTSNDDGPGSFELVDTTSDPAVRTEIVDIPVSTPGSTGSTSPTTSGTTASSTVGTAPHADDDDDHEDDDHEEDDHELEDDSHEGADHDEDD